MATFVDENSNILSNEVPLSSSSLSSLLDKEKIVSNNNDNTIVNSIFTTPNNNNDNDISKDDTTIIDNDNNNDNNVVVKVKEQQQDEQQEEQQEQEQEETLEEKQQREIEESERLAWELMQQEEQQYYQQQVEYMRQNSETISAEDLAAIQQIVNEPAAIHFQQNGNREEGDDNDNEGDGDDDEGDDASENWDYDQLIALGQAIGDVKTERWRLRAKSVIDSLPVIDYDEILKNSSSNIVSVKNDNDSNNDQTSNDQISIKKIRIDHSCTVCMDNFEKTDKLNLLPCSHYFHTTCLQGWLSDHNSCPLCKKKVTCSP